jgi:hypothetical protein
MREARVDIDSGGREGVMGVEPLNLGQLVLNCFVVGRFELRKPRGNSCSTFWSLNCTLPGPGNLVLTCLVKGGKASFKLFEHFLNGIAPLNILEVLTVDRLLNLNS